MSNLGNLAQNLELEYTTEPTVVTYTDTPTNIIHGEDPAFWRPETEVIVEQPVESRPDLNQDIENNVNFIGFDRLQGEAETRGKMVYEILKDLGIPNTIDNIIIDYEINQTNAHEYGCIMGYFDKNERSLALTAESIYQFPIEAVIETIVHEKWHSGDLRLNPNLKESLSPEQLQIAEESMSTVEALVDVKLQMMDEKGIRKGIFMSGYEEYHYNHYREFRDKLDSMPFLSKSTKEMLLADAKEVLVAEVFAIAGEQLYVDPNGQNIKLHALLDKAQLHGYELPDILNAIKNYNAVVFMGMEKPDLQLVDKHLKDFRAKYHIAHERNLPGDYLIKNMDNIVGIIDIPAISYPDNISVLINNKDQAQENEMDLLERIIEMLIHHYEELGLKVDMAKIRKEAEQILKSYK